MRVSSKVSGIAAATAIITVGLIGPASAQSTISVDTPAKILANKLTADSNKSSKPVSVSVPAGMYSLIQGSLDDAHPNQAEQPNERWYAVFYGADGAIVGTTSTTPDLALADISREWDGEPITLSADATTVVYFHSPGPGSDSIYPNVLKLTRIVVSPTVPTTTTPETTLPPTTTTVAPTPTTAPAPQLIVPIVAVLPDVTTTTTAPAAPAPAAAPTTVPSVSTVAAVQVLGLQVENTSPATVPAPAATPEIAFTGSPSKPLFATAMGLVTLGSLMLLALRRHAIKR
jgi:hypothetical protein